MIAAARRLVARLRGGRPLPVVWGTLKPKVIEAPIVLWYGDLEQPQPDPWANFKPKPPSLIRTHLRPEDLNR